MNKIDPAGKSRLKRSFRARRKSSSLHRVCRITQRAAGNEPLFAEEDDYRHMMELLREISGKNSLSLFAFCLIPDSLHLLLMPKQDNLHQTMRLLFSQYAMGFNKKYARKGRLFSGPYRQEVVLDPSSLLAISAHIHLSPVKAGLVKNFINYPWSSARAYFDTDDSLSFVDPDYVLSHLSEDNQERMIRYRQILRESSSIETAAFFDQNNSADSFRKRLLEAIPELARWTFHPGHVAQAAGVDLLSIDELESRIEFVRSLPKTSPDERKMKEFLIEQMLARGFKRGEIAERLNVSPKTLYNILARRRGDAGN